MCRRWLALASLALLSAGLLFAETYHMVLAAGTRYEAVAKYHQSNGLICFNLKSGSEMCFEPDQIDWYATAELNGEKPPPNARKIYRYDDGTWGYDPPTTKVDVGAIFDDFEGGVPQFGQIINRFKSDLDQTTVYLRPFLELSRYTPTTWVVLALLRLFIASITFAITLFLINRGTADVSKAGFAFYLLVSILSQLVYLELGAMLLGWVGYALVIMLVADWLQWRALGQATLDLDQGDAGNLAKVIVIQEILWIAAIWGIATL